DGALVEILRGGEARPVVARSTKDGAARITHEFRFLGERSLTGWRREFGIEPLYVQVSAPNYTYVILPLYYRMATGASTSPPPAHYKYALARTASPGGQGQGTEGK